MAKKNKKFKIIGSLVIAALLIGAVIFIVMNSTSECISGHDKCDDTVYYICQDEKWVSQGEIEGKCGVEDMPMKETYYRFSDNVCSAVVIYPSDKTANDYLTLAECQFYVIPSEGTIILQEADTEVLEDIEIADNEHHALMIKFDISSLPEGAIIEKVFLGLNYQTNFNVDNEVTIYRIPDQNWAESNSVSLLNSVWAEKTDIDNSQKLALAENTEILDVTIQVKNDYNIGNSKTTIGLEGKSFTLNSITDAWDEKTMWVGKGATPVYYGNWIVYHTKESSDISLRPYLKITYK